MTHLGDQLSALVDNELDGAERDRASAHLARCEQCRTEAAALRELKRQLRALAEDSPAVAAAEADVMNRLMAMTGLASGTLPPRRRLGRVLAGPPRGLAPRRGQRPPGSPGAASKPGSRGSRRSYISRTPRRFLVLGTVSIVVGLGTAAFSAGGGETAQVPGPKITPQMQLYSEEHALTTGVVPFAAVPAQVSPSALDSGGSAQEP